MRADARSYAHLEEQLRVGQLTAEQLPLLLEAVRHYRACAYRRGARPRSERRGPRDRTPGGGKGHGRLAADDYPGARRVDCHHPELSAGDRCPLTGCAGHVYPFAVSPEVELRAGSPVQATRYDREVLRCSSCLMTFTAPLPAEASGEKYDASVAAAVALMRFELGVPHHRLARWQAWAGVPLPAATQWELIELLANAVLPVWLLLLRLAANRQVLSSDDTGVRILELLAQIRSEGEEAQRTGLFTTGMMAGSRDGKGPLIALYASGRKHAGENLDRLLAARAPGSPALIHMADAASREPSFEPLLGARCMVHARRYFVEASEAFPSECQYVLDSIAHVYRVDDETTTMTPEERLAHHQEHSAPVLDEMRQWMNEQLEARKVEPNGQLGRAFQYVANHWEGVTLFLREPGVPLDNNITERGLKPVLRHRKNSLFYRTVTGAAVGDVLMSVIRTCILNGVDPLAYLTDIGRHPARVRASPEASLPWNYAAARKATLN